MSDNQETQNKTLSVDFLYLDLSVCTRCQTSENNLDESLQNVVGLLGDIGHTVKLNKTFIETEAQAIQHQFISSPTIRINGRDIEMTVKESYCSTCSSLTNEASIYCRTWHYKGEEYSAPPQALIIDAILNAIYNGESNQPSNTFDKYQLPKNLKEYFDNKDQLCANVSNPPKQNEACCAGSSENNSCC